ARRRRLHGGRARRSVELRARPFAGLQYGVPARAGEDRARCRKIGLTSIRTVLRRLGQPLRGSIQTARARPSGSPLAVKRAVPASCLRPLLASVQPTTTQGSPTRGDRSI